MIPVGGRGTLEQMSWLTPYEAVIVGQAARRAGPCFFFQAEDGIRDLTVTGVQTCALPISPSIAKGWRRPRPALRAERNGDNSPNERVAVPRFTMTQGFTKRPRSAARDEGSPEIGRASCRERV